MGSAFHQLYPRYNGSLTPTAPWGIRLRETFTFTIFGMVSFSRNQTVVSLRKKLPHKKMAEKHVGVSIYTLIAGKSDVCHCTCKF